MARVAFLMTNSSVPVLGASPLPTIRIRRLDTNALVVTDANMTEVGDGLYGFDFTTTAGLEYAFRIDADPGAGGQTTLAERYFSEVLSGTDVEAVANIDAATSSRSVPGDAMALTPAAVDAVWDELRAGHTTVGTMGSAVQALTRLIARSRIDTSLTPWQLSYYVWDEAASGDTVVAELFDLYDQDGNAIAGTASAGNNPLADPAVLVAELRRI